MAPTNEIYIWLMSALFILGVLLVPLGLSFLFAPDKISKLGARLNRWITTAHFFDILNQPRFQERFIYRHHRLFGFLIMAISSFSIYMMLFYTEVKIIMDKYLLLSDTAFGKWMLESLYYLLVGANFLAFATGLVILIRPSALKKFENLANRWFDTEKRLEVLDSTRELPETVFPGDPRIFGSLILIGAVYIILKTKHILI